MPVVAKFVTDFLGFWDWNDPNTNKPVSDARVVYNHLSNCQDYLTYNSDELTVFPRRIEFRASIDWLKKAAEYGIRKVHDMEREKEAGEDTVSQLRHLGTAMAKTLLITHGLSVEQAAAIRLAIALDAVHKSVLMVRECCKLIFGDSLMRASLPKSSTISSTSRMEASICGKKSRTVLPEMKISVATF